MESTTMKMTEQTPLLQTSKNLQQEKETDPNRQTFLPFLYIAAGAMMMGLLLALYHCQGIYSTFHSASALLLSNANEPATTATHLTYQPVPPTEFGDLLEYSVAHSDRSLDYVSQPFQQVMRDLSELLKVTYHANHVAIVPGSGTFGMEAVARQFAHQQDVLILSNGHFGYRWVQIMDVGGFVHSRKIITAEAIGCECDHQRKRQWHPYSPPPLQNVLDEIRLDQPRVVFCTHVETSTGIMLPEDYIRSIAQEVHEYGGILVVDAIASGTIWIDMKRLDIDVLIASPQKDWTSPPGVALVLFSQKAYNVVMHQKIATSSFSLSLKEWCRVMKAYESGSYAYHTTLPTDMLRQLQQTSVEILRLGLDQAYSLQQELGRRARQHFADQGLVSVAAPGFAAPGVLVYYQNESSVTMVKKMAKHGLQISGGVRPWGLPKEECAAETFRVGLFGLDKLVSLNKTLSILVDALDSSLM